MPLTAIAITNIELAFFILSLLSAVLGVCILQLDWRLRTLMKGKGAKDLEGVIRALIAHAKHCESFQVDAKSALDELKENGKRAVSRYALVRFDAFNGTGLSGRQSFAAALVSEKGDGIVLSSMHSRGNTRIFAKPIRNLGSDYELTEEEIEAVHTAHTGKHAGKHAGKTEVQ